MTRFTDDELAAATDDLTEGVREDVETVTAWLEPFVNRRALREYLLENRELNDPRLFIPSSLGLKLMVAAGLAMLDGDRSTGFALLEEARVACQPLTKTDVHRLAGLAALAG